MSSLESTNLLSAFSTFQTGPGGSQPQELYGILRECCWSEEVLLLFSEFPISCPLFPWKKQAAASVLLFTPVVFWFNCRIIFQANSCMFVECRVSWPQHGWHFWLDNSLLRGAVLCIETCLSASLASTNQMPIAPTVVIIKTVSDHCQISPGRQNHPWLRVNIWYVKQTWVGPLV